MMTLLSSEVHIGRGDSGSDVGLVATGLREGKRSNDSS